MNTTQANVANRNCRAIEVDEEPMSFHNISEQLQDVGRELEEFKTEVETDNIGIAEMVVLIQLQSNNNRGQNKENASNNSENRMRMRAERRRTRSNNREYRRQASGRFLSGASTSQNLHGRRTLSPSPSASSSNATVEETEEDYYDPNEPRYCVCNQVSYGDMIACDNVKCEQEWFHYSCVAVTSPPKGNWYCPQCRCNMHRNASEEKRRI